MRSYLRLVTKRRLFLAASHPKLVDLALHLDPEVLHLRQQLSLALRPCRLLATVLGDRPDVTAGQPLNTASGKASKAARSVSGSQQPCPHEQQNPWYSRIAGKIGDEEYILIIICVWSVYE